MQVGFLKHENKKRLRNNTIKVHKLTLMLTKKKRFWKSLSCQRV